MSNRSDNDLATFQTILYYVMFIILSPVITFFSLRYILETTLGFASVTSNVYAAFGAVIILHIALGFYIYKAYSKTGDKPDKQEKPDKQD